MLRPTLIALIAIVVFSSLVVDSNNSQCSPDDQDCAQFASYESNASGEDSFDVSGEGPVDQNLSSPNTKSSSSAEVTLIADDKHRDASGEDSFDVSGEGPVDQNLSSPNTKSSSSAEVTLIADDKHRDASGEDSFDVSGEGPVDQNLSSPNTKSSSSAEVTLIADDKHRDASGEDSFDVSGEESGENSSSTTASSTEITLTAEEDKLRVDCVTPDGQVKNQEFCFYVIDVGDPSTNLSVSYNGNATDDRVVNFKFTIAPFCKRNDNDGIVKTFPAYMNRNNGSLTILSDVWVHCCRYNCKSSLEKMSGKTLDPLNFTKRELALALARSYIKAMPRTAMGLSPIKKGEDTCMTEDFMNAPKLPFVSNCHSVIHAAPNGDINIYSGRLLFNRMRQPTINALIPQHASLQHDFSVFVFMAYNICPLSFDAKEAGFDNSYDSKCYEIATQFGYFRWCCCSTNMKKCAVRTPEERNTRLCANGQYTHGGEPFLNRDDVSQVKLLTTDLCHVNYYWNAFKSQVIVKMSPQYDNSITKYYSGNCELRPSEEMSCPHLLELAALPDFEVECSCNSGDFCNHDMHYKKAEPLQNYKRRCKYASGFEHVFYEHLYTKNSTEYGDENEFFCPVYYDVGKRKVMNLVHAGNMRILANETTIHDVLTNTSRCHVVEVKLNRNAFSNADECEHKEQGYQNSDFEVPRLVMICTCSSNAHTGNFDKTGQYCDAELAATMSTTFTTNFESQLPRCMEAETQFNVETFNSLDHQRSLKNVANPETKYCYQAYMNDTGILESGTLTSKNTRIAKECAAELAIKSSHSNTKMICNYLNNAFMCCCRPDAGAKPCNEFLVHKELVSRAALVDHKPPKDSCGSEQCARQSMGCYLHRWASVESGQETGCTSAIDGLVQENSRKRYLQACEIAENQRKCTVVPQDNGDPAVMCCCKDGVCPRERTRSTFGLVVKNEKP